MTYASNIVPNAPVLSEELDDNHFRKDSDGYHFKYDQANSNVDYSESIDGIALNSKAGCHVMAIHELMPDEPCVNHTGELFYVVPEHMDGWEIVEWTASVITPGEIIKTQLQITDTGGGVTGFGTFVIPAGDRFASINGLNQTVKHGDLINVIIGSGGATEPLGFTYTIKFREPV